MWSMGVIIYHLLCGGYPFVAKDVNILFRKIKAGHFGFYARIWSHVSDDAKVREESNRRASRNKVG